MNSHGTAQEAPVSTTLQLFAPCPRGLEQALLEEIQALGAIQPKATGGGVAFSGDARLAMAVNLHSRIASRVMMQVATGRYRDENGIYRLARNTVWEDWFDEYVSLRVDVSAQRSPLRSLNFVTLRIKDAICDRFREATGTRPSVDTREPEVRVFAFLGQTDITLYLDLSGESLFKRGWRSAEDSAGEAPLKENLAAGLLALSRWTPDAPLHDPFCGSGTLLIEAAQRALDIAPGLDRRFGFERLRGFDRLILANLRQEAEQRAKSALARLRQSRHVLKISGADIDPRAVGRTSRNLAAAGVPEGIVRLSTGDFGASHTQAPQWGKAAPRSEGLAGFIVTNPPYGERLEAQGERLDSPSAAIDDRHVQAMKRAGETLRRAFAGWHACLLSADPELPRQLGMQARRRTPLFNGPLECRFFCFEIFDRAARA